MKKIFLGGSLAAICLLYCLQIKAQRPELMIPATHEARSVKYSPDGKLLVSAGPDGLKLWDVATKTLLKNIQPGSKDNSRFGSGKSPIAFNSNNQNFAFQVEDSIYIFSLDKFIITHKYKVNGTRTVLLLDGDELYAAGRYENEYDDIVVEKTTIGTNNPSLLARIKPGTSATNEPNLLCLSPNKNTLLLYDAFAASWLLDVNNGSIKKQFKESGNLMPFSYMPNGNLLAFTGQPEKMLFVQELNSSAYTPLRRSKMIFRNEPANIDAYSYVVAYPSASQKYLMLFQGKSVVFNANDFTVSAKSAIPKLDTYSNLDNNERSLAPGGEYYVHSVTMTTYDATTNTSLTRYGKFPLDSYVQFVYKNKDAVVLKDRILNFDNGKFNMQLVDPNFGSDYSGALYRLTSDGKRGFIYGQSAGFFTFDPNTYPVTYTPVSKINNLNKKFVGMQVFDDLNLVALTGNEGIYVLDLATLKVLYIIDIPQNFEYILYERLNKYCDFSPDKSKMILFADAKEDTTNSIYCMNLEDNNERWHYESVNIENLRFTDNGKKIMFTSNDKLIYLDAETGKQIGASLQLPKSAFATIISPSSKYAATPLPINGNSNLGFNVGLVDAFNNKLTGTLPGTGDYVNGFVFLKNERYLLTEEYGGICLWDIIKKRKIGKLYMFEKSPDWIFLTDDGRFDATPGALKFMYYTKGKEILPLESLFEKFFVPGLLKQVWDNTLPNDDVPDINKLKKAPLVKINVDDKDRNLEVADDTRQVKTGKEKVIIKIDASSADDVVDEIRLYQNGKLTGTTRNLVVADDDEKNTKEKTRSFNVTLQPGVNNFKAVAINSERTESLPALLDVSYTPAITPPNPASDIQLYLFVVGVNTYKNPKYSLNYASADANAVITALQDGAKNLFSKVNTTYLKDDGATREGMTAAFEKIKSEARPQDMFVFYYAGHGVINDKKEFFLVPYDVTQLYGNDGALAQKGFSAAALQQMSKDIKAQKQLFILDACQSAGALQTIAGTRGQAEEQAIAQLARSTGTQWLTASGSEQFASEFEQLGHGSFTYCLLQAFAGDAGNIDNKLTVKELDAYLQNKVPEITKKYKGTEQYPSSYGYGNDFPIIIIKSKN